MTSKEPKLPQVHVPSTVHDALKDAIVSILHFNREKEERDPSETVWKVLVYDRFCRDIIAPLLTVTELRKHGVTLHLMLNADRQSIPDVEAIYFVLPTQENINRILSDAKAALYGRMHINFCGSVPRPLLEQIASGCARDGSYPRIAGIDDQYCNFSIPLPGIFIQGWQKSFVDLNRGGVSDSEMESQLRSVAQCLLSLCVTLGNMPIICSQRGGAAEMTANLLNDLLRSSNVASALSSKARASSDRRPALLIVDRTADLGIMLSHPFSYAPMLHDILHMKGSRVLVPEVEGSSQSTKKKSVELDWLNDVFYQSNYGSPFPLLAEAVEQQLHRYKEDVADVHRKTGITVDEQGNPTVDVASVSQSGDLAATVQSLPELRQRKKMLDAHASVAYALLTEIKRRDLDVFSALEEAMLGNYPIDEDRLQQLFVPTEDPEKRSDLLRITLIFFLTSGDAAKETVAVMEGKLREIGVNVAALETLKKMRAFLSAPTWAQVARKDGAQVGLFSGLASKAKVFGEQLKVMAKGGSRGSQPVLPVARMVRDLSSVSPTTPLSDDLARAVNIIDPRLPGSSSSIASLHSIGDWIVFVVGGGCVSEYVNILQSVPSSVDVTYGSTELLSGAEFVEQLELLAKSS